MVHNQRTRRDALTPLQVATLEALPGWTWHSVANQWSEQCDALTVWVAAHAGTYPQQTASKLHTRQLGQWVDKQRKQRASLTPARIATLEALPVGLGTLSTIAGSHSAQLSKLG